ncbi:winged helix-turn-helix domain-containing protein [Colwelliaceae bacterium BS250]
MTDSGVEFILDNWLIYPEKSTIKRDDELIHLEPKIMEVLVYLIKNANRVISREELTEQVWQSRFASDEVITRAISVLRKKLGDTGKVHRLIKTVPKHGYVLEHEVTVVEASLTTPYETINNPSLKIKFMHLITPRVAISIAVVALLVIIFVPLIFVKFYNVTSKQPVQKIHLKVDDFVAADNLASSSMVARVLSEQLITTLSNSDVVNVNMNTETSNAVLSNAYMLGGGVKELNNEYHVNLHFIDEQNGNVLWSQSFAGDKDSWHALVNNISQTILYFITVAHEDNLDLKTLSLKSLQAAILIHQARVLRLEGSPENFKISINMLQNALLTFPEEPLLIQELALSHFRAMSLVGSRSHLDQIKELLLRAEQQQNFEGVYWIIKALYQLHTNEIKLDTAISFAERALQANANNVEVMAILGSFYRYNDEIDKAKQQFNEAYQRSPNFSFVVYQLATIASTSGDNETAISLVENQLKSFSPSVNLSALLSQLYLSNGRFSEAVNFLNKIDLEQQGGRLKEDLADSYYLLGIPTKAIELYQQVDVNRQPSLQYLRECTVLTLQHLFEQATRACSLADEGSNVIRVHFNLARNLMFLNKHLQALQQYRLNFSKTNSVRVIKPSYLVNEKTDFIWLLAKNNELEEAKKMAEPLLTDFKNRPRNGIAGYGIADVIILLAIGQEQLAFESFNQALNEGWLQWNDWLYAGQHPALEQLKGDPRYPQWISYINKSIASQKQKINYQLTTQ